MRILIVRFRQMGDAIINTVVMNSLKKTYPDCIIDFVLNERICDLFKDHPSIDHLIPFSDKDLHSSFKYLKKVWKIVHQTHYDIIIDMRSTMNTMFFGIFSPTTKYRIGLKKGYTKLAFNYFINPCRKDESMLEHDIAMLKPLEQLGPIKYDKQFTLTISNEEQEEYKKYLINSGIDLEKPILLLGVTAKLANKTWAEDRMTEIIRRIICSHPDSQIIFNYAPGKEESNARHIYNQLGKPQQVFIDIQAKSQRELVALASTITFYFGNEGGARHIVHACSKPSFVICAPQSSKISWIPQNEVFADGIACSDIINTTNLSRQQQYDAITVDHVWEKLQPILSNFL